ncbi:MAG: hypothetical protein P4L22_00540 [Candidatus Babeliales bacterium]|nr:hypothetical protein [Candidatus Babeliales bacterium]
MYKQMLTMLLILSINLKALESNTTTNPNDVTTIIQSYVNKTGIVWVGTPDTNLSDGYLRLGNDPAPNEVKTLALYDASGNQISATLDGSTVTIPSTFAKALYGNTHLIPLNVESSKKTAVTTFDDKLIEKAIIANNIIAKKLKTEKDTHKEEIKREQKKK